MHAEFSKTPTIRLASAAEVLPLRRAMLRADMPMEEAKFWNDDAPDTLHGGAFLEDRCIACATLLRESFNGEDACRLRGMAVDSAYQSRGLGTDVLEFLLKQAMQTGVRLFWCNARVPAVNFYKRMGWEIQSDIFDIPTAGPHYVMSLRR
jgi:GNAT superfamily N-acetyltransferase